MGGGGYEFFLEHARFEMRIGSNIYGGNSCVYLRLELKRDWDWKYKAESSVKKEDLEAWV